MIKVALNGFGRIGRNFLRAIMTDKTTRAHMQIAAINVGPMKIDFVAHLFKYDTLLGTFAADVKVSDNTLFVNDYAIPLFAQLDPSALPWKEYAIDWVVEATGQFTHRKDAQKHIDAGARKVLISAPAYDDDVSIILGVNQQAYDDKKHAIVSMGSCTTNAIMPILKVIDDHFSIQSGAITTVHAYTSTQVLLDNQGEDLRRARAAALNIVPTPTGADSMIQKIMPSLQGKIISSALRVPVPKVSFADCTFLVNKPIVVQQVKEVFIAQAQGALKSILNVSKEPLVSSDFAGSSWSVAIDEGLINVAGNLVKVCGWYDNEWAYSVRLKDFLSFAGWDKDFNQVLNSI